MKEEGRKNQTPNFKFEIWFLEFEVTLHLLSDALVDESGDRKVMVEQGRAKVGQ